LEINRVIRNLNGAIITIEIDGVEYRPMEKPEPEPRTGYYIRVDEEFVLQICNQYRFREDSIFKRHPNIVDADDKRIGWVHINSGEVSIE